MSIFILQNAVFNGFMKNMRLIFLFLLVFLTSTADAQEVYREVRFVQVDSLIHAEPDGVTVVNFWATWCKPCVAELPYFRRAAEIYRDQPVRFVFISLDFETQIQSKLVPFLERDPLPGSSWWLNERKLQPYIDKVDPRWSGAIPFTLFIDQKTRSAFEGEITQELLEQMIAERL
jgi:thiol-disulfide isomerase/thioredoxin